MKSTSTICTFIFALAIFFNAICSLHAQLIHVPLEKRMATAQIVIEGEVIHSHSFYGDNGKIYTSHLLRIDKVMKGSPATSTLEIILEGGTVGDKSLWISHHLFLGSKSSGVFFLNPLGAAHPAKLGTERLAYDVYAGLQGFIEYREQPGATIAAEPFRVYRSIADDFYPLLGWTAGDAPVKHMAVPLRTAGSPTIDSIRPLEVTAGTRTTLSIYGHGFQATRGSVYFADADQGGATMMVGDTTDVNVWTDSLIQVWVPSLGAFLTGSGTAGTGSVTMQTALGDSATSNDILQVRYAIQNKRTEDTLFQVGISRFIMLLDHDLLVGNPTSGGYTFHFTTAFSANDSAKAAFLQGLRNWRCATGVNFNIGADTSLNIIDEDYVNVVRWDDAPDTLPAGALAFTKVWGGSCEDFSETAFAAADIDFTFGRNVPWNFDTTANVPGKFDFFSVALHEIGHAHCLDHVIDIADIMNYNIPIGQRNAALTPNALEGAFWVMDSSTVSRGNCPDPMIPVPANDCNMLPVIPHVEKALDLQLAPNPNSGIFSVHFKGGYPSRPLELKLFDSRGNCIPANLYDFCPNGPNVWEIDLKNLPFGLYFANFQNGMAFATEKVIRMQ
jgi:hypothetical protein